MTEEQIRRAYAQIAVNARAIQEKDIDPPLSLSLSLFLSPTLSEFPISATCASVCPREILFAQLEMMTIWI